jgi:putative nucleotidyltransferase with HDIG domain
MGPEGQGGALRAGYLPRVMVATLVVTVLPGLAAGALQAVGLVESWLLSAGLAVVLSMVMAAAGSAWWVRRPASRDIVFSDLMLWGWLRRLRIERRLASARWLLGRAADLDPARQTALLERLSAALEARDPYTHGHSRRVTRHAHRIARQLGLPPEQAARIRTAAAVHDVGKIDTPREVLNKPDRLTDAEFAVIRRHPVEGAEMVAALGDEELTAIVRHHHERLDGGGYPDGLSGSDIPVGARVIAVADTFDALTSSRPYRSGCRHKKALDILRAEAGTQLDPDAVAAFLSYYSGRRALPWCSAAAAAPSRLASWLLSGVQGATVAPLGSAAAALGATFLVGASLAGTPARGESARPVEAKAVVAGGAGAEPQPARASRTERPGPAGGGDGRRSGSPRGRDAPRGGDGDRAPGGGPGSGAGEGGSGGPGEKPGTGDGAGGGGSESGGGSTEGGGSDGGGGGSGPGDRLPEVPDVPDRPDLPEPPDLPELPNVPDLPDLPAVPAPPKVDLPVLPPVEPQLPPVEPKLPPVRLP